MTLTTQKYEAIVIGTGQAGPSLAVRLKKAGQKVAIIERDKVGGTCVNTGCIPTKTMVASAYAAHLAYRSGDFGVRLPGLPAVDMKAVKTRKDAIVAKNVEGVASFLQQSGVDLIFGQARFESATTVRVGETLLEAPKIFVNVGGRANVPPMPGVGDTPFWTNSSMMGVDFVPPHLVVVGGSYVGLEFAQMFRRFGSEVTVVEMADRLIAREDEDVSEAIRGILEREGIRVRTGAECIALGRTEGGVRVHANCREGDPDIEGSHLLLAVGRRPNTDDLGLEAAGVRTDAKGYIQVDDRLRTSASNIWALGDCNGRGAFTHTAYNDYEIVAANLLDGDPRPVTDRIPPYALY